MFDIGWHDLVLVHMSVTLHGEGFDESVDDIAYHGTWWLLNQYRLHKKGKSDFCNCWQHPCFTCI